MPERGSGAFPDGPHAFFLVGPQSDQKWKCVCEVCVLSGPLEVF